MGDVADRILLARFDIMKSAQDRWQKYVDRRLKSRNQIDQSGPGAANTQRQVAEWSSREARRESVGLLGRPGLEQWIGTTWDATVFAPSEQSRNIAKPVARIVTMPGSGYESEGVATGFLITPRLLLTNYHVFPERAYAENFGANFLHVQDDRGKQEGVYFKLDPDSFYCGDKELDYAIVGICSRGTNGENIEDFNSIRLIEATGKILIGFPVNIIEHPNGGPRQYATTNNHLLDILDEGFLHYETDTDHGSSGSPVFSGNWEIVALHHCGIPEMQGNNIMKKDGSVWNREHDSESDINWVANEGTRVSFIVNHLKKNPPTVEKERRLFDDLLARTSDPLNEYYHQPVSVPVNYPLLSKEGSLMPQNIFNITGNVTINVFSGYGEPSSAVSVSALLPKVELDATVVEKKQNFDPKYSERKGFNSYFLGSEIFLPKVIDSRLGELYTIKDYMEYSKKDRTVPKIAIEGLGENTPLVIPYHHYSLVMNKEYRMLMWAASNADYSDKARQYERDRKDYGSEDWRPDPRVPTEFQLLNDDIYQPAGRIDRGHIVRRDDNCWGDSDQETEYANADSYHWTNCTPQHELFNQESPRKGEYSGRKGVWGFFERKVADEIKNGGGKAILFAGPVLNDECRSQNFGKGEVKFPVKFWKVVVVPKSFAKDTGIMAYGYIFDQSDSIKDFGIGFKEALVLQDFKQQATSLRDITALTGVEFDEKLYANDQLA